MARGLVGLNRCQTDFIDVAPILSKQQPRNKLPLQPHTRLKMGNASSAVLDNIVQGSNCTSCTGISAQPEAC
jgi:hypothetical protein